MEALSVTPVIVRLTLAAKPVMPSKSGLSPDLIARRESRSVVSQTRHHKLTTHTEMFHYNKTHATKNYHYIDNKLDPASPTEGIQLGGGDDLVRGLDALVVSAVGASPICARCGAGGGVSRLCRGRVRRRRRAPSSSRGLAFSTGLLCRITAGRFGVRGMLAMVTGACRCGAGSVAAAGGGGCGSTDCIGTAGGGGTGSISSAGGGGTGPISSAGGGGGGSRTVVSTCPGSRIVGSGCGTSGCGSASRGSASRGGRAIVSGSCSRTVGSRGSAIRASGFAGVRTDGPQPEGVAAQVARLTRGGSDDGGDAEAEQLLGGEHGAFVVGLVGGWSDRQVFAAVT